MMQLIKDMRGPFARAVTGSRGGEDRIWIDPASKPYAEAGAEPSLDDVFKDPIVKALMAADGLRQNEIEDMLSNLQLDRDV